MDSTAWDKFLDLPAEIFTAHILPEIVGPIYAETRGDMPWMLNRRDSIEARRDAVRLWLLRSVNKDTRTRLPRLLPRTFISLADLVEHSIAFMHLPDFKFDYQRMHMTPRQLQYLYPNTRAPSALVFGRGVNNYPRELIAVYETQAAQVYMACGAAPDSVETLRLVTQCASSFGANFVGTHREYYLAYYKTRDTNRVKEARIFLEATMRDYSAQLPPPVGVPQIVARKPFKGVVQLLQPLVTRILHEDDVESLRQLIDPAFLEYHQRGGTFVDSLIYHGLFNVQTANMAKPRCTQQLLQWCQAIVDPHKRWHLALSILPFHYNPITVTVFDPFFTNGFYLGALRQRPWAFSHFIGHTLLHHVTYTPMATLRRALGPLISPANMQMITALLIRWILASPYKPIIDQFAVEPGCEQQLQTFIPVNIDWNARVLTRFPLRIVSIKSVLKFIAASPTLQSQDRAFYNKTFSKNTYIALTDSLADCTALLADPDFRHYYGDSFPHWTGMLNTSPVFDDLAKLFIDAYWASPVCKITRRTARMFLRLTLRRTPVACEYFAKSMPAGYRILMFENLVNAIITLKDYDANEGGLYFNRTRLYAALRVWADVGEAEAMDKEVADIDKMLVDIRSIMDCRGIRQLHMYYRSLFAHRLPVPDVLDPMVIDSDNEDEDDSNSDDNDGDFDSDSDDNDDSDSDSDDDDDDDEEDEDTMDIDS